MFKELAIKAFAKTASAKTKMIQLANQAKTDLASEKKGQGILEYAVLFIFVGLGLVMAVGFLKDAVTEKMQQSAQSVSSIKVPKMS